jgi:hypothetical protein
MQSLAGYNPFSLAGVIAALLLASAPPSAAQQDEGQAVLPPRLTAVVVAARPVLDGVLDDHCWRLATHIDGFWRENFDAPEIERTEAWICYDSHALYVAFRCHDSRPSEIRSDQTKRGGSMSNDDRVSVTLDVEDAGRNSYQFRLNPAGTQQDSVPGGTSEKIEWRGDWRAAARTDQGGWTAELAIPFSFLRYPQGQDCFRIRLERRLAREDDDSIWPPSYARRQDPDECARLTRIQTPPVPFRYVLMPYLLSVLSQDEEDREAVTAGLDFRGTFPDGTVALATYKPDFRNLEDVIETIDFTFVERYLPEYRPFFQEGEGYLPWSRGPLDLFYSRRIEQLDWGAKAFGTLGPHRFGVLDAYRRGGENHLAWNYQHLLGTEGSLGFAGVERRVPGEPHNSAHGLGTNWNFPAVGGSSSFTADWYRSRTQGDGGDDRALHIATDVWRRQGLGGWLSYSSVGSQFRADDGYVPDPGVRSFAAGLSHTRSYDDRPLHESEWYLDFATGQSDQGPRRSIGLDHGREWRTGWSAWVGLNRGERDGFDVASNHLGIAWNRRDMYRRGDFDFSWGERLGEPYRFYSLDQGFRPGPDWSVNISAERTFAAELDDDGNLLPACWTRQLVLTTTYDLTDEKTISARLVTADSTTNFYAAYRQRARRGVDLLILLGDPNADQWVTRLAAKAIWCF